MSFDDDAAMQKKWKAFTRKIDTKTDDYSTVLKTIKAFLAKPFTAAVRDKEFTEQWIAAENQWKKIFAPFFLQIFRFPDVKTGDIS